MQISTLQELWDYCEFCPLCQSAGRQITISFVPSDGMSKLEWKKKNEDLIVKLSFKIGSFRFWARFNIDCLNNSFIFSLEDLNVPIDSEATHTAAMYLTGDCLVCNCTYALSKANLDLLTGQISNIRVTREGLHILSESDKFHILVYHKKNELRISQYVTMDDDVDTLIDLNKVITLPMIDLDLTNIPRLVSKIKTMIIFS